MIVSIHTNIDEGKRQLWPGEFSCRPMTGDYVESSSGLILKICQVTHTVGGILRIELTRGGIE